MMRSMGRVAGASFNESDTPTDVVAALVAATPIVRHGGALLIGVAGTSPATTKDQG
jgi:hypothetical protein